MCLRRLIALLADEDGQDLVEYALLMGFLALVAVAVLQHVNTSMSSLWNSVTSSVSDAIRAVG